jgi:PII-like signaling protein
MKNGDMVKKLTIYVDEKDKSHHRPVYEVLLDILHRNNIAGASVFRGISGYGADMVLHSTKMLDLSTNLPLKIEAVDSEEKIDVVLPEICEVVEKGLVEISDTLVVRCDSNRKTAH